TFQFLCTLLRFVDFFFFFFFQAEDGIRDATVTGVQTCALPISAGVRTSLFVCLATALFTILSGEIAHRFGDTGSTRIASNIVQGIGFLGAGAILRDAGGVVGMNTATTGFVEVANGMATGGGLYAVAVYATGLALFGLVCI